MVSEGAHDVGGVEDVAHFVADEAVVAGVEGVEFGAADRLVGVGAGGALVAKPAASSRLRWLLRDSLNRCLIGGAGKLDLLGRVRRRPLDEAQETSPRQCLNVLFAIVSHYGNEAPKHTFRLVASLVEPDPASCR